MNKQEMIAALIKEGRFSQDSAETLNLLPDGVVTGIHTLHVNSKEVDALKTKVSQLEADKTSLTAENTTLKTNSAKPKTTDEYLATLPPEVREQVSEGLKLNADRRKTLIDGLKANSRCPFSETELNGKTTDELVKLAKLADVPTSYAGAAGAAPKVNAGEGQVPVAPTMKWDAPTK